MPSSAHWHRSFCEQRQSSSAPHTEFDEHVPYCVAVPPMQRYGGSHSWSSRQVSPGSVANIGRHSPVKVRPLRWTSTKQIEPPSHPEYIDASIAFETYVWLFAFESSCKSISYAKQRSCTFLGSEHTDFWTPPSCLSSQ